jgi:hypothetical protein
MDDSFAGRMISVDDSKIPTRFSIPPAVEIQEAQCASPTIHSDGGDGSDRTRAQKMTEPSLQSPTGLRVPQGI